MEGLFALIAGVVILLAIGIIVARMRAQKRSAALRDRFGPEYDRALEQHGDRARAERELIARKRRLAEIEIHPLSHGQREKFAARWAEVQQRFVDDPSDAVVTADRLVKEVMQARGYPMGDFEQRVADLSVEHANVVDHYRAARALAAANAQGQAGTEELRQAMVHYRSLFQDLLEAGAGHAQLQEAHA